MRFEVTVEVPEKGAEISPLRDFLSATGEAVYEAGFRVVPGSYRVTVEPIDGTFGPVGEVVEVCGKVVGHVFFPRENEYYARSIHNRPRRMFNRAEDAAEWLRRVDHHEMGNREPIQEGKVKKGGQNSKPTTRRPVPPRGQG